MKNLFAAIKKFFFPPAGASKLAQSLPLVMVAVLMTLLYLAGNYTWETTGSDQFCGLTCHTMPPEYVTHQNSAHANVTCEDCHMGRGKFFDMLPRKATYSWQTGSAMVLNTYHYPIIARNMRPARDVCENCHTPEKFSNDKLIEIKQYADNENNSPTTTYLAVKTGGGTKRLGLGLGIHWHIENPVYFYSTDTMTQSIPYVLMTKPDGTQVEYIDAQANFEPSSIKKDQLQKMDCITCHNRTAHLIEDPEATVDGLISRDQVSSAIPMIHKKAVELFSVKYNSVQEALDAIAGLPNYYRANFIEFYSMSPDLVDKAVVALQETYKNQNFPDQLYNWETHPNNLAHKDTPGCFRCHDGKHMSADNSAIRLECNLCHSVPVVSAPNQITSNIPVSKGFEPESHKNPNWISLHRQVFDDSCKSCHTIQDPGGTSNQSFCSNSACHGSNWKFAGFNAPQLRSLFAEQAKKMITPTPVPTVGPTPTLPLGPLTYQTLAPIFNAKCGTCHGENGMKGVTLTSYEKIMAGSIGGPLVVPGNPDTSLLVKIQSAPEAHFGQFSTDELDMVRKWIQAGAPEK